MTPVSYSQPDMGTGSLIADAADHDSIARSFVDARREHRALMEYPGVRPDSLTSAYAIQDRSIALGGQTVGGWKVGRIWAPDDARLGADRLAGPIYRDVIVEAADDSVPAMPIFADGFAAAEAEFMIRLAPPAGAPSPNTDAETLSWIDEVRIGIEVASSPYPGINADGPCVTISDHGNNAGLVLGQPIPRDSWGDLRAIEIASCVDGEEVGRKTAAEMLDGPLGAVRFLLANLASRGIEVAEGTWVSSGAVTGVHPVAPGQTFMAAFEGIGEVACAIRAY
ncbi:2-keto-4-pentenoate hydratase [Tsuneonella sp. HG094]